MPPDPDNGPPQTIDLSKHGGAQTKGPPQTISLLPTGQEKPLQNVPGESDASGTLKNFGTSLIRGVSHIPAVLGDVAQLPQVGLDIARSKIGGRPYDEVVRQRLREEEQERVARAEWFQKTYGRPMPARHTPMLKITGEKIAEPILSATGEYQPTTNLGRAGSAFVEGATAMGGLGGIATRALPAAAKGAVLGGLSGASGQQAAEITGDPLAGLIAGALVPGAAAKIGSWVSKGVRPFRPSQHQAMADELLLKNTRDPNAASAALRTREAGAPPISQPSTAEVTMDPGHVIADKLAKARSTEYQQMAKERETGQNTARRSVVSSLADPTADPVEVSKAFRQYLSDVEADHGKTVADLEAKAKQRSAGVAGVNADEVGGSLRNEVKDADARYKQHFSEAYDALDPDKKLNMVANPVRDAAAKILDRPNRDLEPESKLAQSAIEKAQGLDDVVSFERMRTLDTTLTKLMAEARRNADPGYHDIVQLKGAVKDAFANAVENQIKYEQNLVARGEMHPEDTFANKLRQQVESYYADKSRASAATGTAENEPVRPGGVSGTAGEKRGPGTPPGGEGLPRPNLEPDTAQRLSALNKEYGEYRSLYGAEPLASSLKTTGFKDQFKIPDAQVAAKAFPPGDAGYQATSRWLEGAGTSEQALADIKSIAVGRLRDMMKGDTLTPETLNAWKSKYAPALRAIDEASPGFSDNFNTAASTTRALNRAIADQKLAVADAQKGIAAKFLGLTDPDDVTALIGNAMNAKNSGQQVGALLDRLKGNNAAIEGAKKAAIDWLLNRSSKMGVSGTGENLLSTDRVVNFVRDNPAAIRKLFGDDGLDYLKSVSDDLQRTQKLLTAQATAGSDTASKLLGKMIAEAEEHAQGGTTVGGMLNLAAAGEMLTGDIVTALKIKAGQTALEKAQHFFSHRRGAGIAEVNRMFMEGLDNPAVAKAMLERTMLPDGKPNTAAFARLAGLLGMTQQAEEAERKGRADGGKVSKIDYAAKAAELLRIAEKAKKAHGKTTESLLKYPDQLIAGALRLANQDR